MPCIPPQKSIYIKTKMHTGLYATMHIHVKITSATQEKMAANVQCIFNETKMSKEYEHTLLKCLE